MTVDLLIIKQENALATFTKPEGLDPFIEKVRKEVESHIPDLTTEKGRKAIASLASKVAKTKIYLDGVGKDLVSDWKAKSKLVDNSRKSMREELDELKIIARKPLTDWEREEQKRIDLIAAQMKYEDDYLEALDDNELFDFRKERAERVAEKEKEAELKRKKEHFEKMEKEAGERAEQKIKQAKEREKQAKEREKKAKEDAKQAKIDADKRQKLAVEKAKADEIKRQDDEKKAAEEKQKKIESNRRHVGKIRSEIKNNLMTQCDIDEPTAKKIVLALVKMDKVTINY